jgi:hypothetical protein
MTPVSCHRNRNFPDTRAVHLFGGRNRLWVLNGKILANRKPHERTS